MGKTLWQLALALIPVSAAAVAAAVGAWWVVGVMLGLAALAGATQLRPVQERVPLLRTRAMRWAAQYQSGYELRSKLRRQQRAGGLDAWERWQGRTHEWDAQFWPFLRRMRDDWQPLERATHDLPTKEFANWVDVLITRLDERLKLIERLMEEDR